MPCLSSTRGLPMLEDGQHLGRPFLYLFLPFMSLGFPFLFSVIKGIGGCLYHLI